MRLVRPSTSPIFVPTRSLRTVRIFVDTSGSRSGRLWASPSVDSRCSGICLPTRSRCRLGTSLVVCRRSGDPLTISTQPATSSCVPSRWSITSASPGTGCGSLSWRRWRRKARSPPRAVTSCVHHDCGRWGMCWALRAGQKSCTTCWSTRTLRGRSVMTWPSCCPTADVTRYMPSFMNRPMPTVWSPIGRLPGRYLMTSGRTLPC